MNDTTLVTVTVILCRYTLCRTYNSNSNCCFTSLIWYDVSSPPNTRGYASSGTHLKIVSWYCTLHPTVRSALIEYTGRVRGRHPADTGQRFVSVGVSRHIRAWRRGRAQGDLPDLPCVVMGSWTCNAGAHCRLRPPSERTQSCCPNVVYPVFALYCYCE